MRRILLDDFVKPAKLYHMSIRSDIESLRAAMYALDVDMVAMHARMQGPRWKFARANLAQAQNKLAACVACLHETELQVPEGLDNDA